MLLETSMFVIRTLVCGINNQFQLPERRFLPRSGMRERLCRTNVLKSLRSMLVQARARRHFVIHVLTDFFSFFPVCFFLPFFLDQRYHKEFVTQGNASQLMLPQSLQRFPLMILSCLKHISICHGTVCALMEWLL